jgi:hypothetical protein
MMQFVSAEALYEAVFELVEQQRLPSKSSPSSSTTPSSEDFNGELGIPMLCNFKTSKNYKKARRVGHASEFLL